MPDLLEQIRTDVHARLSELRPLVEEHRRLETALRALTDAEGVISRPASTQARATRATGRRQTRPATATKGRARAPRGANRQALLDAVRERPGATAAELAAVSGIERNALHGVLRRLVQDGHVQTQQLPTRRTGYTLGGAQHPKTTQNSTTTANPNQRSSPHPRRRLRS